MGHFVFLETLVRKLIKMLELEGVTFTMDALHCQKETMKEIIESKNNYIVQVKGNQPTLQENLKKTLKIHCPEIK